MDSDTPTFEKSKSDGILSMRLKNTAANTDAGAEFKVIADKGTIEAKIGAYKNDSGKRIVYLGAESDAELQIIRQDETIITITNDNITSSKPISAPSFSGNINGSNITEGNARMDSLTVGNLVIDDGETGLKPFRLIRMTTGTEANEYVRDKNGNKMHINDYVCTPTGWDTGIFDINEKDDESFIVTTRIYSNYWVLRAKVNDHNGGPFGTFVVDVLCISTDLASTEQYGGRNFNYTSQ